MEPRGGPRRGLGDLENFAKCLTKEEISRPLGVGTGEGEQSRIREQHLLVTTTSYQHLLLMFSFLNKCAAFYYIQVFGSKKSAQVENRGASPLCAVIILRSVSPPALDLCVLHNQGLACCLEHNSCSVYLYGLVDKMNKILLLFASLP